VFAVAQAWASLSLLFFLSPEAVFFRDYGHWVKEGPGALTARVRAVRWFSWLKVPVFLLLSAALAGFSGKGFDFFCALVWAFSIVLGPQITGADREFLRVDLELRVLNIATFFQKTTLLGGTAFVAWWTGGNLPILALVAFSSLVLSMGLCWALARSALKRKGELHADAKFSSWGFIWHVLKDFTIWNNLCGNIWGWMIAADVLFLSWTGLSERSIGLYSSALKLANLSFALPTALQSVFMIWIGRKAAEKHHAKSIFPPELNRIWPFYALVVVAQAALLAIGAPYVLLYISKQKWSAEELVTVQHCFYWAMGAAVLVSFGSLHQYWFILRTSTRRFFWTAMLPWGISGAALMTILCFSRGIPGALWAKQGVAVLYFLVLFAYTRRLKPGTAP
jgi:hypothetical protein